MKNALDNYLDKNFKRVIHTGSATWCADDVWIIYSTDGITNSCNGIYIHKYDFDSYSLIERFDDGESEWIKEINHYMIGENLREFLSEAKKLVK